jgi:hypothetical protein
LFIVRDSSQPLDSCEFVFRSQVSIPRRHLDGLVSHQFRNSPQIHPSHHQATRKSVPQAIPSKIPNASDHNRRHKPVPVSLKRFTIDVNKNLTLPSGPSEQFLESFERCRVQYKIFGSEYERIFGRGIATEHVYFAYMVSCAVDSVIDAVEDPSYKVIN